MAARNRIEVLRNRSGKWYWRKKSPNGKTVAVAEAYYSKSNAVRAGRKEASRDQSRLVVI